MSNNNKILLVLFLIIAIILFILPAQLKPWSYPSDDCYFYLQIAKNIAAGNGSTFHQITPTNGYHPLWMLFCVISAKIASGNNILLLRIIIGFQACLFLGILFYFIKITKLIEFKYYYISIPILCVYFLATGVYASECHLNGFLLSITLYYLLKYKDSENRLLLSMIGLLLGLLFLIRLDNIFIIGIIFIYLLLIRRKKPFLKNLNSIILVIFPFLLLVLPYLAWNYFNFGNIIPISGAIKSSFPRILFEYSSIGLFGIMVTSSSIITLFIALMLKNSLVKHLFIILSLGVLLHAHYYVMYSNHLTNWLWYFVPGVINFCMIIVFIIEKTFKSLFKNNYEIQVSFSILITLFLTFIGLSRTWSEYFNPQAKGYNPIQFSSQNNCDFQKEIAYQLNKIFPKGTSILMYDWPGKITYFSDMRILPIDGLVNDYNYQNEIVEKGILEYLKEKNINYFIGPYNIHPQRFIGYENFEIDSNRTEFRIYSSLYNKPAGSFIVDNNNLIIRFKDSITCEGMQDMALWRLY